VLASTSPSGLTPAEQQVLSFTVARAQQSLAAQATPIPTPTEIPAPPVQVPAPPVQLPPVANSLFQTIASVFVGQPVVAPTPSPCLVGVSVTGMVSQNVAQIGDTVTFTYTVTNLGTAPLTVVQAAAALPSGLNVANASSGTAGVQVDAQPPSEPRPGKATESANGSDAERQVASSGAPSGLSLEAYSDPGGAVDPSTGYVGWAVDGGVAGGATTALSMPTTVGEFGQWTPTVCVVGMDAASDMVYDCEQVTVVIVPPPPTPTPSPTASSTPTGTVRVAPTQARTGTPVATSTSAPTSRPKLNNPPPSTSTPVLTRTPGPAGTPLQTPTSAATTTTPGPTSTPELTATRLPTSPPAPTNTPQPTAVPHPTDTPRPTEVPQHPTETPHPTETHD
jgi:uncharacterized repeat protein (TIGR01451 family)